MLGNQHPNRSNAANLSSNTHYNFSSGSSGQNRDLYQASLLPESTDLGDTEYEESQGGFSRPENGNAELNPNNDRLKQHNSDVVDAELSALGLTELPQSSEEGQSLSTTQGMSFAKQVWRNALSELAMSMPPATYDTWMKNTQIIGYEDGEFIIGVPNAYACDWIKKRLRGQIKKTLSGLLDRQSLQVTFRVVSPPVDDKAPDDSTPLYHLVEQSADVESQGDLQSGHQPQLNPDSSLPNGQQNHTNQNGISDYGSAQNSANNYRPAVDRFAGDKGSSVSIKLNSFHTFDTFVVGKHNRMAHAAAEAISDNPGASFNPLFVYGGVGLGKTHLLHAIGNRAIQNGFNILYCTSEQFTNELILAIRNQSTEYFRNKYRQVDILLIDDIQFIGGKESTQEEFFHTFNHLHAAGKQVILSSDRPPKALPTLEERLRSRFEGGLQTDISKPDFETRVAILQSKAATVNMSIEPAALMLIAERVDSNIRELEGALNRIVHQARFFSNKLDIELTEAVLKNLAPERTLRTPTAIIEVVAEHFDVTVDDLTGRSRTKNIAHARQMAMYLLREENAMSLPSIGDHLGGRDHSTVRHGVEKISKDLESDGNIQSQVMTLREKIYAAPSL